MTTATHEATITHCYENLGWAFTLLSGKKPIRPGWQSEPRLPLDDVLEHFVNGGNVGLRTGLVSRVVVVDIDGPAGTYPDTVEVATGRGRHLYYYHDVPFKNHVKVAPHVDIRGDGGQVVFPGSKHPETGTEYVFTRSPFDTALSNFPADLFAPKPAAPGKPVSGRVLLKFSVRNVLTSVEGERNNALNKAAFACGQLIKSPQNPTGDLDQFDVEARLFEAATQVGLGELESRATIHSGIRAGMASPRKGAPEYVLCPGMHLTSAGEYIEQGVAAFTDQTISILPNDLIYRRARIPGEITGTPGRRKWNPLSVDRARIMVDDHTALKAWVKSRDDGEQKLVFRYCLKDWGGLVVAGAESHPAVRDIEYVTSFPVFDKNWNLTPPGYQDGIYYDEPDDIEGIEPERDFETIHRTLYELIIDFPFMSNADRQNYIGLLLTPIVQPAVRGNRPLHIITAPIPRTGKSKLAEDVLGGVLKGQKTPALQITGTDDERDKRITALLLQDETVVHLDNLPPRLDSPALASLLTASVYQSRLLGSSKIISLPNNLTLVGTGNNLECSTEIAKRCVPIRLQPTAPNPERRVNFHFPNLWEHVRGSRRQILSCLLGMVENWKANGRRRGSFRLGGFESWSEAVGGILHENGFSDWMKNTDEWLNAADSDSTEMEHFVDLWSEKLGSHWVSVSQILESIRGTEVLQQIFLSRNPSIALGKILKNYTGAPIGRYVIYKRRLGRNIEYNIAFNGKYVNNEV